MYLIYFTRSTKNTPEYFTSDTLVILRQFEWHTNLFTSLHLIACNLIEICSGLLFFDIEKGIKAFLLLFNIKLLFENHLFTTDRLILAFDYTFL